MKDNLKNLFTNLKDKQGFIELCAKEFEKKPLSIQNNWFGRYWAIPEKHLERVVILLQTASYQQYTDQYIKNKGKCL
mgnify:CR=1 FL=1